MGRIVSLEEILEVRRQAKTQKQRVVFTNGVFDILHRGHVEYLAAARAHGDLLFVGLNTDASVRRIKGEKKPIVREGDRAFILSQLVCVDFVCLFDEDTPQRLIDAVVPDVLIKGSDYTPDAIVGRETVEKAGGRVITIPLTPDRSTTNIIETIIERYCPER